MSLSSYEFTRLYIFCMRTGNLLIRYMCAVCLGSREEFFYQTMWPLLSGSELLCCTWMRYSSAWCSFSLLCGELRRTREKGDAEELSPLGGNCGCPLGLDSHANLGSSFVFAAVVWLSFFLLHAYRTGTYFSYGYLPVSVYLSIYLSVFVGVYPSM